MRCIDCSTPFGDGVLRDPCRQELVLCPNCGRAYSDDNLPVFGPGDVPLFAIKGVNRWSNQPDPRWASSEFVARGLE